MTKMKPILFSTPMVQAILDGRKTQTRRECKLNIFIKEDGEIIGDYQGGHSFDMCYFDKNVDWHYIAHGYTHKIDDILYVKETYKFGAFKYIDNIPHVAIDYIAGPIGKTPWIPMQDDTDEIIKECHEDIIKSEIINQLTNKAVVGNEAYQVFWDVGESPYRIRPSIFMPQAYARIFLKVTNVRVERLQDISEEDAIAEGIDRVGGEASLSPWRNYLKGKKGEMIQHCSIPKRSYQTLWDSINGKDAWDKNPYVFVYEFERVEKPEGIA